MNLILFIVILVCFSWSCKQSETSRFESSVDTLQFDELETQDQKIRFLQSINDSDQNSRKEVSEIATKFGVDSPEHLIAVKEMNARDEINLAKVEWYLDKYDYPDREQFGDSLSIVPALVIHHSNRTGIRRKYYPKLKEVYDDGGLDPNFFSFYLGRIYEMEKGVYFRMPSPYQLEDQIDSLIVALEL